MKTYYRYLQILTMSCLLLGLKLPGYAQEQQFILAQDQQEENGSLHTRATQLLPATIEVDRTTTQSTKNPIKLTAKLPYDPLDSASKTRYIGNRISFFTKSYPSYILPDSVSATLLALGITPQNANDYRYRVVENDSIELVPWSPIPKFEQKYDAKTPYGFIGDFKRPGQVLMIEVVNRKNYNIRDGVVFHWSTNKKPIITKIGLLETKSRIRSNGVWSSKQEWHSFNEFATQFDEVTGLPLNMKIPNTYSINWSLVLYIKKQPTLHYIYDIRVRNNEGKGSLIETGNILNEGEGINLNLRYGRYEIIIRRMDCLDCSDENVIRIPFDMYEPDYIRKDIFWKRIIEWSIVIFIPLSLLFLIYYIYSRRKIKKTQQQKEKVTLQLKAIRSQLNPHFTFNALNSIQNLMNKNDVEAANHYLTRFASLTRRVLASRDNDMISLADEITLLDDYLQMEQLRFGFTYKINVDAALNKANIEIPFMLLQPFVENAVKHGVSAMADKGLVEIDIARNAKSLILTVSDNGLGFIENNLKPESMGMGLKLSRDRIALLNNMYQNQAISLHIVSNNTGSKITVILADWLA